jgi:hypothetical protein
MEPTRSNGRPVLLNKLVVLSYFPILNKWFIISRLVWKSNINHCLSDCDCLRSKCTTFKMREMRRKCLMSLGSSPRPSRVMIKHNFLLGGILELKLSPRRRVCVWMPGPSRVSLGLRQDSRLTPRVLTTFWLHPRGVWCFSVDPPPRV